MTVTSNDKGNPVTIFFVGKFLFKFYFTFNLALEDQLLIDILNY